MLHFRGLTGMATGKSVSAIILLFKKLLTTRYYYYSCHDYYYYVGVNTRSKWRRGSLATHGARATAKVGRGRHMCHNPGGG